MHTKLMNDYAFAALSATFADGFRTRSTASPARGAVAISFAASIPAKSGTEDEEEDDAAAPGAPVTASLLGGRGRAGAASLPAARFCPTAAVEGAEGAEGAGEEEKGTVFEAEVEDEAE